MGFDDYVTKPVTEDQLRDVVDSLLSRRQYDDRLQELFSLMSKRHVLEAEKSDADLATHDEYATLVEQIAEIRSSLDERVRSFDDEDFRASFLTLQSTQPDRESYEFGQENPTDKE